MSLHELLTGVREERLNDAKQSATGRTVEAPSGQRV